MARSLQEVKQTAQRFGDYIGTKLPVRKVLLYGSYAKGTPRKDSDIDIAVFIDDPDHQKRLALAAQLWHFAGDIDVEIEPKCFFWDEYQNHENASILAEIIRTSIELK